MMYRLTGLLLIILIAGCSPAAKTDTNEVQYKKTSQSDYLEMVQIDTSYKSLDQTRATWQQPPVEFMAVCDLTVRKPPNFTPLIVAKPELVFQTQIVWGLIE